MSIRHIVLWKLAADDADTRALHAEQISERLMALREVIDDIAHIEPKIAQVVMNGLCQLRT